VQLHPVAKTATPFDLPIELGWLSYPSLSVQIHNPVFRNTKKCQKCSRHGSQTLTYVQTSFISSVEAPNRERHAGPRSGPHVWTWKKFTISSGQAKMREMTDLWREVVNSSGGRKCKM
jgi:hypothetical protein